MLKIEALAAWLLANTPALPQNTYFALNRRTDRDPDALIQIGEIGGPPMIDAEETYDNPAVQIFTRSPRDNAPIARDMAHAIDRTILDHKLRPFNLAGFRCIAAGRLGGGPGFWEVDDDNRTVYFASYWFTIQR